jgi:CheY-like chemotaxis protein
VAGEVVGVEMAGTQAERSDSGALHTDAPFADVLVVDDDPSVRSSMTAVLRSSGLTVTEAADGQEAVDVLARHRVTVVVLDLHMAPRDGIWLLGQLADGPRRSRAVIVVSAFAIHSREEIAERFAGIVTLAMQKPVPPTALIEAVWRAVESPAPA